MFPILPVEIIAKIIYLTLPTFSLSSSRKRYILLLKYTKVCWMWKEIAEELLYRNVLIESVKSLNLVSLRWKADTTLSKRVETISINLGHMRDHCYEYISNIYLVLNACTEVKEIWLMAFSSAVAFNRSMNWSTLKNLRSLHLLGLSTLTEERLAQPVLEPDSFPSLKHLSIINCSFPTKPDFLSSLLTHKTLPSLTSLSYQLTYHRSDTPIQTIDPFLFNQIKSLILYDTYGDAEDELMDSSIKMEALTTLVLYDGRNLDSEILLTSSSPFLSKLIILDDRNDNPYSLENIEKLVNVRHSIKEILIRRYKNGPNLMKTLAGKKIKLKALKFTKIGNSKSSFVQSLEMFEQLNLEL